MGSAPNAAIFFCTYDTVKRVAVQRLGYQVRINGECLDLKVD